MARTIRFDQAARSHRRFVKPPTSTFHRIVTPQIAQQPRGPQHGVDDAGSVGAMTVAAGSRSSRNSATQRTRPVRDRRCRPTGPRWPAIRVESFKLSAERGTIDGRSHSGLGILAVDGGPYADGLGQSSAGQYLVAVDRLRVPSAMAAADQDGRDQSAKGRGNSRAHLPTSAT
jgi:hypothetical protein